MPIRYQLIALAAFVGGCGAAPPLHTDWTVRDLRNFLSAAKVTEMDVVLRAVSIEDRGNYFSRDVSVLSVYVDEDSSKGEKARRILQALRQSSTGLDSEERSQVHTGAAPFALGFIELTTRALCLQIRLYDDGFWIGPGLGTHCAFRNNELRDEIIQLALDATRPEHGLGSEVPPGFRYALFVPPPLDDKYRKLYWCNETFPYEPSVSMEEQCEARNEAWLLIEKLGSPDPGVWKQAAEHLLEMRQRALPALVGSFIRWHTPVNSRATDVLLKLGRTAEGAVPWLESRMKGSEEPMCWWAAVALVHTEPRMDNEAFPFIRQGLRWQSVAANPDKELVAALTLANEKIVERIRTQRIPK